jgi:hypothetical protein
MNKANCFFVAATTYKRNVNEVNDYIKHIAKF